MTTVQTQKAILLHAEGGKYSVGDAPVPRPGPKDVLVKVIAAALNPIDWKITIPPYSRLIPRYPFIGGTDGAGIVAEVGDEVTGLKTGDRILFQGWFQSPLATFQQHCIIPAELAALIPPNISFDQAASVPVALTAVVLALYNQHPNYPKSLAFKPIWGEGGTTEYYGKPAFILGGASSVGQYAIQIAKHAGYHPIITTASPHNRELLTSLGATHVVDRSLSADAILAKLPELTDGKPIEFVYDSISLPETMPLAYKALAPGGGLAILLGDVVPEALKVEDDGKRIAEVFGSVHVPETRACGVEFYKTLSDWLEKGIIKPNAVEILPGGLAGVQEGLERLRKNQVSGKKLIVRPQEAA